MNWTGGPKWWTCWSGPDISVGQIRKLGPALFQALDTHADWPRAIAAFSSLEAAKAAVERAVSRQVSA